MRSARKRSRSAARSSGTRACSSAPGTTSAQSSCESHARQKRSASHVLPMPDRRSRIVRCPPLALLTKGGGGVRSRERRSKRSVRRAWPGRRAEQPGESALRSRQSIARRIEGEIAAFRVLDMREVALAHGFRKRLVRRFPERRAQGAFASGFHVGFHHALEDSPGKAEQQTMNSHLSRKKNSSHP